MSQFIICEGPVATEGTRELCYRQLRADEELSRRVAVEFFAENAAVRVPVYRGRDLSMLFDEAHDLLVNGAPFVRTDLGGVLPQVLASCNLAVFWWGDDWADLPSAAGIEDAVNQIADQLEGQVGEVYLRWIRASTRSSEES